MKKGIDEIFNGNVIQFFHPGKEHLVDNPGYITIKKLKVIDSRYMPWNDAPQHRRKYICSNGSYIKDIDSKSSEYGKIVFWGEWEPESKIIAFNENAEENEPHYLHVPCKPDEKKVAKILSTLQNTDPYIFGADEDDSSFKYCCCKQISSNKPTKLQELHLDDIILFGSYSSEGFLLDTLFIVGNDVQEYSQRGKEKLYGISPIYKCVSIDRVRNGNQGSLHAEEKNESCLESTNLKFKLYKSISYKMNKEMFSFFPCSAYKDGGNNFKSRVVLNPEKFGLSTATQGVAFDTTANGKKESILNHFIEQYRNNREQYYMENEIRNELDKCLDEFEHGIVNETLKEIITRAYWNAIAGEVLHQDHYLGVFAEEPKK